MANLQHSCRLLLIQVVRNETEADLMNVQHTYNYRDLTQYLHPYINIIKETIKYCLLCVFALSMYALYYYMLCHY